MAWHVTKVKFKKKDQCSVCITLTIYNVLYVMGYEHLSNTVNKTDNELEEKSEYNKAC